MGKIKGVRLRSGLNSKDRCLSFPIFYFLHFIFSAPAFIPAAFAAESLSVKFKSELGAAACGPSQFKCKVEV